MNFEEWWFNNELNLDFYNFEKEEAGKVWRAAVDEAIKIADECVVGTLEDGSDAFVPEVGEAIMELKNG